MVTNTCALPALLVDLALAAALRAIWFNISATFSEIAVGKVIASAIFFPMRQQAKNQHRQFCIPSLHERHR
jgi:hypothetical protein